MPRKTRLDVAGSKTAEPETARSMRRLSTRTKDAPPKKGKRKESDRIAEGLRRRGLTDKEIAAFLRYSDRIEAELGADE